MISLTELKNLGEEGFIPGPAESEEEFVKRVDILKSLSKNPEKFMEGGEVEPLACNFQSLGAAPKWIPKQYSNRRLLPWQGAVAWTFKTPEGVPFPMIQLRKGFKKGSFLLYDREEVLAHETLHALRLTFEEPRFEEILAYSHAKRRWRRLLGPLFRTPGQALVFISLILLSLGLQFLSLFYYATPYLKWAPLLPLGDLFFRFTMLLRDRRILRKTLGTLKNLFPKWKDPFAIAIRLKDKEIQQFSHASLEKILLYIKGESETSVRWQQILAQFS